jgi:hypothetical protein
MKLPVVDWIIYSLLLLMYSHSAIAVVAIQQRAGGVASSGGVCGNFRDIRNHPIDSTQSCHSYSHSSTFKGSGGVSYEENTNIQAANRSSFGLWAFFSNSPNSTG